MIQKRKEQISVVIGCVIRGDAVLFIRRFEPQYPEIHGNLELPGGKIEFGENPATAVKREIYEETGIDIEPKNLLPFSYVAIRRKERHFLNVIVWCYRCEYISEKKFYEKPKKVAEKIWVPLNKLDLIDIQSGSLQFLLHILNEEKLLPDNNTCLTTTEYLTLNSITLEKNRKRTYNILIEARINNSSPFRIQCQWGRLGEKNYRQTLIVEFDDRDKALYYINNKLKDRKQHNYKIVEKSDNFPNLTALLDFPIDKKNKQQLELF
jgi:8-oxo-dGTP pyrophosphatase MutT (NUDIX family)/predicted DNA-binding WGR domain protein